MCTHLEKCSDRMKPSDQGINALKRTNVMSTQQPVMSLAADKTIHKQELEPHIRSGEGLSHKNDGRAFRVLLFRGLNMQICTPHGAKI